MHDAIQSRRNWVVMWTKERIIALNKLICEVSGQPHAIRDEATLDYILDEAGIKRFDGIPVNYTLSREIAELHPFVDGNKRTAACIAICETLKNI